MDPRTATIVVVDDAPEVRLLVRTRLRLTGRLEVVGEGADGEAAIALARTHHPDLMLLDVSMPEMDGLEALPRVLAASPGTRVVLYSGFEQRGLAERARELGAAAFVEKSAPVDSLVDRLVHLASEEPPGEPAEGDVGDADATPGSGAATSDADAVQGAGDARDPGDPGDAAAAGDSGDQGVLDDHRERFREVFEEAAIGMATMTLSGRLVRANRALAALLHRPTAELVGLFYGDLTDGRGDQVLAALADIRHRSLDVVHLEHGLALTSEDRSLRATLAPVRDSAGRPLYLFLQVQDVTAERAATEALRKSEERFRLLVDVVEDYAIFMLDPTGHVMSWNAGAQRSQGYRADEIIGRHFRVFYPPEVAARKHPERELELAVRDGHYEEEGWRVRKDGSRFWAIVLITAVFNDEGTHIGFTKVTRDMTGRRRLEQEREQAVAALAEANAELEVLNQRLQRVAQEQSEFLAVTAHELRTPIGVLAGTAETLTRYWRDLTDEDRTELLDGMGQSTNRLRLLLSDLLTASRLERSTLELKPGPVLVDELVTESVAALRRTSPDVDIQAEVPTGVTIQGDRDRLAQILDNLLGNALRHGAPPIRVTAEHDHAQLRILVTDAGPGVSETMRPRLFERFATGRNRGGTGLGLFIVRELARAHHGEVTYDPPAEGSPAGTFVVNLPLVP